MADYVYFRLYAKEYLSGAASELPLDAQGAYMRLLCYCWTRGSVPIQPARLGRILGCSGSKAKKLWAQLDPLFDIEAESGRRTVGWLEEQRHEVDARSEAARESAKVRWATREGGDDGD